MADRAVTPMVGKALEAALVVLFIGVVTTGLYAGVVPDYRSATAAEVGDRTLVTAVNEVERAVPAAAIADDAGDGGGTNDSVDTTLQVSHRVELPGTLRSQGYTISATTVPPPDAGGEPAGAVGEETPALALEHPHPSVGGTRALALPDTVVAVTGEWTGGDGRVEVEPASERDGVVVRLVGPEVES